MNRTSAGDTPARYPLLVDLTGRDVLVAGGGPVAARRAQAVVAAGGQVQVIAPALCEDLTDLVTAGAVSWLAREASADDVDRSGSRWWLVHTATGDLDTDAALAQRADRAGIWCVRADDARRSAAHLPAVATGPDGVQVAVSGGGDPGRAKAVRDAIADQLATGSLPLRRTRRGAAPGIGGGPVDDTSCAQPQRRRGTVVLVGGGPGDPGLLTVAGRQWLMRADVVITDRLGPTSVLAQLDPQVQVIDVGKTAGNHPIPQEQINDLLVEHALAGRTVVRLKGGDPFVLGRGGEEAQHCRNHDVPVQVVPGVTSAVSVPAAAGIPVTHRGITTSMVVASAHAGGGPALDAARAAPPDATVVLLMGLAALGDTARDLITAGRRPDTAVAVIEAGWTDRQRTVVATLATIADRVAVEGLTGPVVIVVGEVVGLRERLGDLTGVSRQPGGADRTRSRR